MIRTVHVSLDNQHLGNPTTVPSPVDTCAPARPMPVSTPRGDAVPYRRVALHGGPHASPGVSGVSLRRLPTRSARIRAWWPSPISRVGSSHVTTIPAWAQPKRSRIQLDAMGFPVGCRVTTFSARFWACGSVATHGNMRSARHLGGRHGTSTEPQLPKIVRSRLPIPQSPCETLVSGKRIAPAVGG
jgi:hypothetical protein